MGRIFYDASSWSGRRVHSDDIETVIYYYKQNMAANSWYLEKETPLEQKFIKMPASRVSVNESCPGCSPQSNIPDEILTHLKQGSNLIKSEIKFTRGPRQRCRISVSQLANELLPSNTQIGIVYHD